MAHFAQLDDNNVVLQVVVVDNKDTKDANGVEKETIGIAHLEKILGGTWKQTSYNASFRKNFAGIGCTYDAGRDAFIGPKPFNSWVLDETTCIWGPPTSMPSDAAELQPNECYEWDEATVSSIKKTR
jgi:hypothetical protein